ncbi:MAG: carotenoid oxygenase family protein, partial [Pseudomonadota bacterium]
FYLGAHLYERGATFVDSFRWTPDAGSKILLIDKNDLESQRWFDAPPGFVFHNAHAFDRGSDIVLRTCLYSTAGIMDSGMFELMRGPSPADYPDYPRARLTTITLNLRSGRTRVNSSDTLLEFPGIDPRYAGGATAVHGVGHGGGARPAYSNSVVRLDPESDRVSRYVFPAAHIVEEPLIVAAESRDPKAGWLIGTFLDVAAGQTGVYVFDAQAVDAGPVALARMPRSVPLGFHGCFVRAA